MRKFVLCALLIACAVVLAPVESSTCSGFTFEEEVISTIEWNIGMQDSDDGKTVSSIFCCVDRPLGYFLYSLKNVLFLGHVRWLCVLWMVVFVRLVQLY